MPKLVVPVTVFAIPVYNQNVSQFSVNGNHQVEALNINSHTKYYHTAKSIRHNFVLDGGGYSPGAKQWLTNQAGKIT